MNIIYRILILRCQEIINMPIKIDSLDYQTWVFLLKSLQKVCDLCMHVLCKACIEVWK